MRGKLVEGLEINIKSNSTHFLSSENSRRRKIYDISEIYVMYLCCRDEVVSDLHEKEKWVLSLQCVPAEFRFCPNMTVYFPVLMHSSAHRSLLRGFSNRKSSITHSWAFTKHQLIPFKLCRKSHRAEAGSLQARLLIAFYCCRSDDLQSVTPRFLSKSRNVYNTLIASFVVSWRKNLKNAEIETASQEKRKRL